MKYSTFKKLEKIASSIDNQDWDQIGKGLGGVGGMITGAGYGTVAALPLSVLAALIAAKVTKEKNRKVRNALLAGGITLGIGPIAGGVSGGILGSRIGQDIGDSFDETGRKMDQLKAEQAARQGR